MSTEELERGRHRAGHDLFASFHHLMRWSAGAAWLPKCAYGSHVQRISSGQPSHSTRTSGCYDGLALYLAELEVVHAVGKTPLA